jgi:hypothetical protein
MNRYLRLGLLSTSAAVVCLCIVYGRGVPIKEQLVVYEGLRSTAAIVFAVMGAWIAILYPGKLATAFGSKSQRDQRAELLQINRLFRPMIYSTVILLIVTAIPFSAVLAKQVINLAAYKEFFRAFSFTIVGILVLMQLWSIILTLIPGDNVKGDLTAFKARKDFLERMKPGRSELS